MRLQHIKFILILTIMFVFQACNKGETQMSEQAVIIDFNYGSTNITKLYALEDELEQRLTNTSVGEFDGHEIAADGSGGTIYLYGTNAKQIYETIKDILTKNAIMNGAIVTLRYGPLEDNVQKEVFRITQGNGNAP